MNSLDKNISRGFILRNESDALILVRHYGQTWMRRYDSPTEAIAAAVKLGLLGETLEAECAKTSLREAVEFTFDVHPDYDSSLLWNARFLQGDLRWQKLRKMPRSRKKKAVLELA